jgi:hypothetical protein
LVCAVTARVSDGETFSIRDEMLCMIGAGIGMAHAAAGATVLDAPPKRAALVVAAAPGSGKTNGFRNPARRRNRRCHIELPEARCNLHRGFPGMELHFSMPARNGGAARMAWRQLGMGIRKPHATRNPNPTRSAKRENEGSVRNPTHEQSDPPETKAAGADGYS